MATNNIINFNELMIGDWVKVNPISHKVEPHISKVLSIRKEYENGFVYIEGTYQKDYDQWGKFNPRWYGWSVSPEDLSPIPITPEILEKNGFERREDLVKSFSDPLPFTYELYTEKEYIGIVVEWLDSYDDGESSWKGYWAISIDTGLGTISIKDSVIYVHQFQHAMRLAGVNKELIL